METSGTKKHNLNADYRGSTELRSYVCVSTSLNIFNWDLKKFSSKIVSFLCRDINDILSKK